MLSSCYIYSEHWWNSQQLHKDRDAFVISSQSFQVRFPWRLSVFVVELSAYFYFIFFFRFIKQNDIKYSYKNPHNYILNHKFCKKIYLFFIFIFLVFLSLCKHELFLKFIMIHPWTIKIKVCEGLVEIEHEQKFDGVEQFEVINL